MNHPTQTTTVPSLDYDVLGFTLPPRHHCPRDPIPTLSFECACQTTDDWGLSFALGDHGLFGGDSFRSLVCFFKALCRRSLPRSLDEIIAAILVLGRSVVGSRMMGSSGSKLQAAASIRADNPRGHADSLFLGLPHDDGVQPPLLVTITISPDCSCADVTIAAARRRRSTALAAPSSLVPFRSLKSTLVRRRRGDCVIHPSICVHPARAPPPALSVRSFCEIAWICARHHHHLPARPNNWQWLYPPKGRPRDAAFPGRNMCHSDWQFQCTCALWLVRGGVINSHQYDQDSTVKPPTRGRGIVSLEDLVSLLLLLRCYILISFGPQFSLGNELCSTKISGITIPLFPFPIVTWLLRWSSLVLFTVAILRDVARRHCRPIRRETSNNKREDRQTSDNAFRAVILAHPLVGLCRT